MLVLKRRRRVVEETKVRPGRAEVQVGRSSRRKRRIVVSEVGRRELTEGRFDSSLPS